MKIDRKTQERINDVLRDRDIHPDQVKFMNTIRIHPTETLAHLEGKMKKCYELYKDGHPFLTEVWTRDRKQRFDLLNILDNIDIEFETGKSKDKQYAGDEVIFV